MIVKEIIYNKNAVLYSPDGFTNSALPYVCGYLPGVLPQISVPSHTDVILFSWNYCYQDIGWVSDTDKPVVIGGKHAELLSRNGGLPLLDNVTYFTEPHIDVENPETRVVPDYKYLLRDDQYTQYLTVHSGQGCDWRNCTFCVVSDLFPYRQYDPTYIAERIAQVNRLGKTARLSGEMHTVDWLSDVESCLPPIPKWSYWCNSRGVETEWHKLRHLRSVFIGSEYLSDSVLKRVKKGLSANDIINSIESALDAGINVETTIITDLYSTDNERAAHEENLKRLIHRAQRKGVHCGMLTVLVTKLISKHSNIYVLQNNEVTWRYNNGIREDSKLAVK